MSEQYYPTATSNLGSKQIVTLYLGDYLSSGELVSSVSSVTEVSGASGLVIANQQVNTVADYTSPDFDIEIGQAVQFQLSTTSQEPVDYLVKVVCVTDGSPSQTITEFFYYSFIEPCEVE